MSEWWEALLTVEKVLYCIAVPSTIILVVQTIMLLFGAAGHEGYNPSDTSGIDFDHDLSGLHGMDISHDLSGLHGMDISHDPSGLHGMDIDHNFAGHGGMDMDHNFAGHGGMDMDHSFAGHGGSDIDHDVSGGHGTVDIDVHYGGSGHEHAGHSQPQDFGALRIFTIQGLVGFFTMFSWSALAGISQGVRSTVAMLIGILMGAVLMYIVAFIIRYSNRLSEDGTFKLRNALGETAVVYLPIPPDNSGSGKVNISIHNRFVEVSAVTNEKRTIRTGESVRIIDIINDSVVVEIE